MTSIHCVYRIVQEEGYLREPIKASLAEEQPRNQKSSEGGQEKKMSSEAADLLIDFMDDSKIAQADVDIKQM